MKIISYVFFMRFIMLPFTITFVFLKKLIMFVHHARKGPLFIFFLVDVQSLSTIYEKSIVSQWNASPPSCESGGLHVRVSVSLDSLLPANGLSSIPGQSLLTDFCGLGWAPTSGRVDSLTFRSFGLRCVLDPLPLRTRFRIGLQNFF